MIINFENNNTIEDKKTIEGINVFNKLMINTIKANNNEFEFNGNNYKVCSDGVCVQTLINKRFLYRIFIEEYKNNSLTDNKLFKLYIENNI